MEKPIYRAVIFDLDGTAVDSKYNITALAETYHSYFGKEPSQEDLELTYGMTAQNSIRYLGVDEADVAEFERQWTAAIYRLCKSQARLYDGIWESMLAMKEAGILLGVNTSRRMDEVEPLRHYIAEPFLDLCQVIVTCDKVQNPKPAPDSLQYFLERTGLSANQVLFVGDSEFDSGCAHNAGCPFVLATWGAFRPETIPAEFRPEKPIDLLSIVGLR